MRWWDDEQARPTNLEWSGGCHAHTIPDAAAADEKTREWGARLAAALPELEVVVAEDRARAERAIADRRRRLWHDPARPLAPGAAAQMAAGAAGGAACRLLLSRADRASAGDHQFPRDLQRPYRRACDGLCSGLCPRPAALHPAATAPRMEKAGAERGGRAPARGDGAGRRRRRHRQRDRAALRRLWHARHRGRRAPPRHAAGGCRIAPRRRIGRAVAACRFCDPDRAAHPRDRGLYEPDAVSAR